MRIVLLGPPGAGKGTQAQRIRARHGLAHISTGDMMRAAVASGSALGRQVKAFLDQGRLVPDELVVQAVRERLAEEDCGRGFLLDGFPRTVAQAAALDALGAAFGRPLSAALEIAVPHDELVARLTARAAKEGRSDDRPEVIAERLAVYEAQTRPVSDFYRRSGRLVTVSGQGTMTEVWGRIAQALDALDGPPPGTG